MKFAHDSFVLLNELGAITIMTLTKWYMITLKVGAIKINLLGSIHYRVVLLNELIATSI